MNPADAPVLVDREALSGGQGKAGIIRLNRPDQLNPIDWDTVSALDDAVSELSSDRSVRVILFTGAGRAFSAGGDLKAYQALQQDPVRFPRFLEDLHACFTRLRSLAVPTVALVNGVTAAGGLELLLSCDVSLAARSARIGDGHLNFGQMGGGGVLTLLPRFIGIARASELVFSGRFLTAEEACSNGLVGRVVDDSSLMSSGLELANSIGAKSSLAVANAKSVMNAIWSDSLGVRLGLRIEREKDAFYCLTSKDAPEGLRAFAEKRDPKFSGE